MRKQIIPGVICMVMLSSCMQAAVDPGTAAEEPDPGEATIPSRDLPEELTPEPDYPPAQLMELDQDWYEYVNYRLGFSIHIPRLMYRHDAGCWWNETEGDSSFRPLGGLMPVVVVEDEDRVTITSKYFVRLTEPTQIPSGSGYVTRFGGCEWMETDLDALASDDNSSYRWVIAVQPAAGDGDLEQLIDAYYGNCYSLSGTEPLEGENLYQVHIKGDGLAIEESQCLVNFAYTFLYSEDLGVAATWSQGQSYHFPADEQYDPVFDERMMQSFQFLSR